MRRRAPRASDTVYAAASAEFDMLGADGTLRIARLRQGATSATRTVIVAEVAGSASITTGVFVHLVAADAACPATDLAAPGTDRMFPARAEPLGPGAFTATFATRRPVPHGRWRVCAALAASATADAAGPATTSATLETGFSPKNSLDDRVRVRSAGRGVLRCMRGTWMARPRVDGYRVAWRRNGRPVRGADGWRLRTRRDGSYRCIVTARNRFRTARVRSPQWQRRPWLSD